jgi:acyl carrier protein
MLPVVYRTVETLPMTPSGKIDREGFSAVPWSPLPSGEGPGLPANQLQRDVANIWAEVLGIDTPGVFDNFFDIGGDSLRMVQVHLRLSEFLPTRLAISTLFEFPTISSLSEHLSSVQSPGTTNNGLGARAQNQRVAQERMREAAKRRRK